MADILHGSPSAALPTMLRIARTLGCSARTTPRVRAELQASKEKTGVLANLAALKQRRIRAYLPPGRARHGEGNAAGRRPLTKMPLMRAMAKTLKRAGRRSRYRLRKQVVEPVFGQIKHARGFRQFLMRGLDQVRAEWAMICTAHNLLKLANATDR